VFSHTKTHQNTCDLTAGKKVRNVLQSIENRVRASSQLVARKNNITHTLYSSSNFEKNDVIPKKTSQIPKYTPTQLEKIPRCCRFLLRKDYCDQKMIVMDFEKCFIFSQSTLTGMDGFWTNTYDTIKYKAVGKFEPKVLVWCAISKAGVSTPFIVTAKGLAIDADVYITKSLSKMVKCIKKYHKNDETIF
jgi:hypothetical protein